MNIIIAKINGEYSLFGFNPKEVNPFNSNFSLNFPISRFEVTKSIVFLL